MIFEDNYPTTQGDCYSLKKAFANAGFEPAHAQQVTAFNAVTLRVLIKLARLMGVNPTHLTPQYDAVKIRPNDFDAKFLRKHLEVYFEFPPVFKAGKTRWGDDWDNENYPTPEPLFQQPDKPTHDIFVDEALFYTWVCYAKLK